MYSIRGAARGADLLFSLFHGNLGSKPTRICWGLKAPPAARDGPERETDIAVGIGLLQSVNENYSEFTPGGKSAERHRLCAV